jgi:hypothetical protein
MRLNQEWADRADAGPDFAATCVDILPRDFVGFPYKIAVEIPEP